MTTKAKGLVAQTRAALLNPIAVAVYTYQDARTALLDTCRAAERGGVSRDDIIEFCGLAYLGKALGRSGVTVTDIATLRAIAQKPSVTTKVADDLKRTDREEAAWVAARQGKSRAIASLGWISKTRAAKGAAAPIATNAEKKAMEKAANAEAGAMRRAMPKFADFAQGDKWSLMLADVLDQGVKQNAQFLRGPVLKDMVALIVSAKKHCSA